MVARSAGADHVPTARGARAFSSRHLEGGGAGTPQRLQSKVYERELCDDLWKRRLRAASDAACGRPGGFATCSRGPRVSPLAPVPLGDGEALLERSIEEPEETRLAQPASPCRRSNGGLAKLSPRIITHWSSSPRRRYLSSAMLSGTNSPRGPRNGAVSPSRFIRPPQSELAPLCRSPPVKSRAEPLRVAPHGAAIRQPVAATARVFGTFSPPGVAGLAVVVSLRFNVRARMTGFTVAMSERERCNICGALVRFEARS